MCPWECPWEFPPSWLQPAQQCGSTCVSTTGGLQDCSRKAHGARKGAEGNPGNPYLNPGLILHQNSLTVHVPGSTLESTPKSTPDPTPEQVLVHTWPGAAPGGNDPHGNPTQPLLWGCCHDCWVRGFLHQKNKKLKQSNPGLQIYLQRPRYDHFICWLQARSSLAKAP